MVPRPKRIRVVFDCMVFLQAAARRDGPAGICLSLAEQAIIELSVSREILDEIGDVLRRPSIQAKFPSLTGTAVAEFIAAIESFATRFDGIPSEFALERDPKDEPYRNLAFHAEAEFLVTRDKDLLEISFGSSDIGKVVSKRCPALKIVEPVTFLHAIRQLSLPAN